MRYEIEHRGGIIGIKDTLHPDYQETNGFSSNYPFVVKAWTGKYNKEKGYWVIAHYKIGLCYLYTAFLNYLHNREASCQ